MTKKRMITAFIILIAVTLLIWVQRKNEVEDVIQTMKGMPYELVLIEDYGRYSIAICKVEDYLYTTITKRTLNRHKAIYSGCYGDFMKSADIDGITFNNVPGTITSNKLICHGVIGDQRIDRVILRSGTQEEVEATITSKDNYRVWTAAFEDDEINEIEIECLNSKGEILKTFVNETF